MPQRSPTIHSHQDPARARLFFALCPDEPTREAIYRASRNVAHNSGGRPVPPENFHITLAFLGSVPQELEERVAAQAAGSGEAVEAEPFSFELDQIGHWPSSRVIWYGCTHMPAPLHDLAMDLRRRLHAAKLPPDPGKFVPHVTLARWVQKPAPLPAPQRIRWEVRELVLVRSETLATGVRYTPLARCPLGRQGVLI
jgi:2'-5' RNA ligase